MEIITFNQDNGISTQQANDTIRAIGEAFNAAASKDIFETYRIGKAAHTRTRHDKELKNFSDFLTGCHYPNDGMTSPQEWSGVTFGIIEGYKRYMLNKGYSVNSTNQTLYIIKAYAALAGKAGYIPFDEMARIREVKGFKTGEAAHIDQQRKAQGAEIRIGYKKQTARNLSTLQVERLKHEHPDTLKGKRDALIFALFLDMGLRESELLSLSRESFDMDSKTLHWHREKTNNNGHESMSRDVIAAADAYFSTFETTGERIAEMNREKNGLDIKSGKRPSPKSDLFATINKWGQVTSGLSMRGLVSIVQAAGETVGIENLSPHDLRHSMALRAYLAGIPLKSIQRRLGHSSVKTTERYIDIEALDRYNDFDREF